MNIEQRPKNDPDGNSPNVFWSQDQLSGLFVGFALTRKCVSGISEISSYNGLDFLDFITESTHRIVKRLEGDNWYFLFDNDNLCRYGYGPMCEGNAFGIAKAAEYITGYKEPYASWFPRNEGVNFKCLAEAWVNRTCEDYSYEMEYYGFCMAADDCGQEGDKVNQMKNLSRKLWGYKGCYSSNFNWWVIPVGGVLSGFFIKEPIPFGKLYFDFLFNHPNLPAYFRGKLGDDYDGQDYSGSLALEYACITNDWLDKNDNNRTFDALKYYGERYHLEIYPMINSFLYGRGEKYSDIFKTSINGYVNSAPPNGVHKSKHESLGPGVPGWCASNKWTRPLNVNESSDKYFDEGTGMDYMILHNMMWLEKSNMESAFNIQTYTYPEYYLYPTKSLDKAFYPLHIKTYEPLTIDKYSDNLVLNATTPYQDGSYSFEAPEITIEKNVSVSGPAEFIISNDKGYDLKQEFISNYKITDIINTIVCPEYEDEIVCLPKTIPFIKEEYTNDLISYTWRLYNNNTLIAEKFGGKRFTHWTDWDDTNFENANKIEVEAYYNGNSLSKLSKPFYINDDCCAFSTKSIKTTEHQFSNEIIAVPNPFKHYIDILHLAESSKIEIFDKQGRIIYKKEGAEGDVRINTESLKNGLYVIKISSESNCKVIKMVHM